LADLGQQPRLSRAAHQKRMKKETSMKVTSDLLRQIAAEQGPSFYLLDSARFRQNFTDLTQAFRAHYERTVIAYSYKTNYVPRFVQLVAELGGYAEVVSSMEMALAQKIGVPASKIFFNGPYKEIDATAALLGAGGTVNVDHPLELDRIVALADSHEGAPLRLGLRCNFDVQDGVVSRFGFDVDQPGFRDAIARIDAHPGLELTGLHCHFATRSLDSWRNRTLGMLDVIDRHFRDRLDALRQVSLGGGLYGRMPDALKAQFPVAIPSFAEYANVASKPFRDYFSTRPENERPELLIEPGTALVADALKYACTVNGLKCVRGQDVVSLTGSSYNMNPNPNRKNVPIEVFPADGATGGAELTDALLGGYTCIESDYLYKGYTGHLSPGDMLVFDDIGSYSVVMKPPFILPNVAIVEPDADGADYSIVKRKETFEDIFRTYSFI